MEKLLIIQSELKAPKNQRNSFGQYNYRSCEDILEALKPLLLANKCTLTLNDELILIGERYYIKATATLTDGAKSIQVNAFAREEETKKGMDGSQITGASSSYARKYALNALFLIDDQKDSDATNIHKDEPKQAENKEVKQAEQLTDSQRPTITNWMSESIFNQIKDSFKGGENEKVEKAMKNYKGYSKPPYGMKKAYKEELEKLIKDLGYDQIYK